MTATSPRRCRAGQFSCPLPGGCIEAGQRCDGVPDCPKGEDETGCHPHGNITTMSDRWRALLSFVAVVVMVVLTWIFGESSCCECCFLLFVSSLFIKLFFHSLLALQCNCSEFLMLQRPCGLMYTGLKYNSDQEDVYSCSSLLFANSQTIHTHSCSSQDSSHVYCHSSCSKTNSKQTCNLFFIISASKRCIYSFLPIVI